MKFLVMRRQVVVVEVDVPNDDVDCISEEHLEAAGALSEAAAESDWETQMPIIVMAEDCNDVSSYVDPTEGGTFH